MTTPRVRDPRVGQAAPESFTVGTASAVCRKVNQSRERLVMVNDSDVPMYFSKGGDAVLNAGIRLNAHGGTLIDEPDENGFIYTGPWSVIAAAAAKNLCISEE